MQGDLISRSALIEQLRAEGNLSYLVKGAIDNAPTAYDVDKVVEQLKTEGKKMSEAKSSVPFGKHSPANHRYYKAISVKKAEMLVRNGGKEQK